MVVRLDGIEKHVRRSHEPGQPLAFHIGPADEVAVLPGLLAAYRKAKGLGQPLLDRFPYPVPAGAELVGRLLAAVGHEHGHPGGRADAQLLPGLLFARRLPGPWDAVGDDGHGQVQVAFGQPRQPARRGDQGGVEPVHEAVFLLLERVRVGKISVAGRGTPAVEPVAAQGGWTQPPVNSSQSCRVMTVLRPSGERNRAGSASRPYSAGGGRRPAAGPQRTPPAGCLRRRPRSPRRIGSHPGPPASGPRPEAGPREWPRRSIRGRCGVLWEAGSRLDFHLVHVQDHVHQVLVMRVRRDHEAELL